MDSNLVDNLKRRSKIIFKNDPIKQICPKKVKISVINHAFL
ncbi:hypothetical protein PAGA_a3917 [Pseudoalteromonas agarivorans DSM 14585]|uniref:Uncharacterized protein n=1 Tax=Pseudoalteromonas agarivorans DSM 14585 TaxID=1312369 RepID=A0ACA8E0I1_9GAMM|nr:hypothetical protein PAGA_a3917 [Pseudoalteromonas agarivorans DSM 14585]